jgi:hypothetical protein
LFGWRALFPGLCAALRRFTPGYCSISASSAEKQKGKWQDEAGMAVVSGSSSLGTRATGRRSWRTETFGLFDCG